MTKPRTKERLAVLAVIGTSASLSVLAIVMPVRSAGDGHAHEHGHGGEEEHEEGGLEVELDDDVLEASGMTLEKAEPATLKPVVVSRGQIVEDANRAMNVKPRFSGIVKSIARDFGDQVKRGDLLMVIESAATRSTYEIRTSIDGIIADRRVVPGSFVPENETVLRVVDLKQVWFKGRVAVKEAADIKSGAGASVEDDVIQARGAGKVTFVSPTVDEDTQSRDVRVAVSNDDGGWRVGSFAKAKIELEPKAAAVTVKHSALQDLNGQLVVFKRDGEHLIAVPVATGWTDEDRVQIVSGLSAGEAYVAKNSYLAKAELLKASAEHEH